ncbi:MAG TPA: hypothetical protein VKA89_02940 [Solirubrobacterales bacterium]|nr:hypothetical protein [Solirubrobacterales bacterium]
MSRSARPGLRHGVLAAFAAILALAWLPAGAPAQATDQYTEPPPTVTGGSGDGGTSTGNGSGGGAGPSRNDTSPPPSSAPAPSPAPSGSPDQPASSSPGDGPEPAAASGGSGGGGVQPAAQKADKPEGDGFNEDFRIGAHDAKAGTVAATERAGSSDGGDGGGSFPTAPLLVGLLAVAALTGGAFLLRRRAQPSAG